MATNLSIDQELLEQAKALSGLPTKRETVNAALREFIQNRQRQQLLELQGQLDFHADFDPKALRYRKLP